MKNTSHRHHHRPERFIKETARESHHFVKNATCGIILIDTDIICINFDIKRGQFSDPFDTDIRVKVFT